MSARLRKARGHLTFCRTACRGARVGVTCICPVRGYLAGANGATTSRRRTSPLSSEHRLLSTSCPAGATSRSISLLDLGYAFVCVLWQKVARGPPAIDHQPASARGSDCTTVPPLIIYTVHIVRIAARRRCALAAAATRRAWLMHAQLWRVHDETWPPGATSCRGWIRRCPVACPAGYRSGPTTAAAAVPLALALAASARPAVGRVVSTLRPHGPILTPQRGIVH